MVSGTHTIHIPLGIPMGVVWEYHGQGVTLSGVPENPTEPSPKNLLRIFSESFNSSMERQEDAPH